MYMKTVYDAVSLAGILDSCFDYSKVPCVHQHFNTTTCLGIRM